ncbi:amino acid permease [Spirillospora sp. NPDC048911]|uniref:amino acid permease n=1 Tax=Spirillospora sp. NPDC048911 TaxID=3364527 RepID=UPI00371A1706
MAVPRRGNGVSVATGKRASARPGSPLRSLLRTKPVDQIIAESGHGEGGELRRTMSLLQLTLFSVGATLGTGIFFVLGQAVPEAGPAVVLGFVLAAVTALFSALSYAELAGTIPVSGSSYSYTYATMGELVAWVCGWCLLLEYAVSVSAVASSWGGYLNEFFQSAFEFGMPAAVSHSPGDSGGVVNLPAVLIVVLAMLLLLRGTSESATANTIMVLLKISVLAFFCFVAFTAFDTGNFSDFAPMGWAGVSAAGSKVFFSYIGFDAASTAGEEAKNPRRDLPLAILLSLVIVTVIYVLVGLAAVGAMPWGDFESTTSLADVLNLATGDSRWAALILSFGVVISMGTVVLTVLYGQTRILFAMARDGLIPKIFERVSRAQVPVANTLIVSAFVALLAAVVPLGQLAEATSIGTLFAFALVNLGVIVLRRTRPDMPRSFRAPLYPVTPLLGVAFCAYLMYGLDSITWVVFLIWSAAGLAAYFAYGYRHSNLAGRPGRPPGPPAPPASPAEELG